MFRRISEFDLIPYCCKLETNGETHIKMNLIWTIFVASCNLFAIPMIVLQPAHKKGSPLESSIWSNFQRLVHRSSFLLYSFYNIIPLFFFSFQVKNVIRSVCSSWHWLHFGDHIWCPFSYFVFAAYLLYLLKANARNCSNDRWLYTGECWILCSPFFILLYLFIFFRCNLRFCVVVVAVFFYHFSIAIMMQWKIANRYTAIRPMPIYIFRHDDGRQRKDL